MSNSLSAIGNDLYVFCPPSLGKARGEGRVCQAGVKIGATWVSFFKMLRSDWEKQPLQSFNATWLESRRFDMLSDELVARIHTLTLIEHFAKNIRGDIPKIEFWANAIAAVRAIGNQFLESVEKEVREGEKVAVIMAEFTVQKRFISENEKLNFLFYLKYVHDGNEQLCVTKRFFREVGVSAQNFLEKHEKFFGKRSLDTASISAQKKLFQCFTRLLIAERFGLIYSGWHPSDTFEEFVEVLRREGPLAIGGKFERDFYKEPLKPCGETSNRAVYEWTEKDKRKMEEIIGSFILLIGAEKKRCPSGVVKNFVYYLISEDPSDPQHPERQRVLRITYEDLTSPRQVINVFGILYAKETRSEKWPYAFCRKRIVEREDDEKKSCDSF